MLLPRFLNFIRGRRHQHPMAPIQTLVCYRRGGLPFITEIPGGPGGYIDLNDDETSKIMKEIDIRMYAGELIGELSAQQLLNSLAFQHILAERLAARVNAPSFT